jgi:antibiotic biosynthesis monooxygenase (ABM) superfamily enzyme
VAEANAPGYLGSELIPPGPGADRVYSAIIRFDTPEHLDEWMNGPARKKLIESGKGIYQDFDATRVSGGFEGWFRFGQQGGLVEVPPVWKQTLSVLFGLYPTVMVLTFLVTSHIKWALAAVLLLGNTLSTFILSYAVMPYIVNPVLQWWLKPDPERRQTIDALGVLFIAAILGILAVFFWQITPVFIK